jgi:anthranilate phosphoribosyltransferase
MDAIRTAIAKVVERENLSEQEITRVMEGVMEGGATSAQIAAFLVGLRMKGETVEEIAGAARVMREKAVRIQVELSPGEVLVETCGTGGSGANTFNVSTTAAFVVAGAGVKVAKHGNRAVSSRSGSADVLEALGVKLTLSPHDCARAVKEVGMGFLFAPSLHPAMKYAVGPRREIGVRTIFNILGPLTNPAGAAVQLLGVYDPGLTRPLAEVLGRLGSQRAWVVHGGGLDELSLLGESQVAEWNGKGVTEFKVSPGDVSLKPCRSEDLKGGDAEENARIAKSILSGEKGPKRDMVLLNAGAAIYLAGRAASYREGVTSAAESIDSGEALKKLDALVHFI